jgi:hypothetical protein
MDECDAPILRTHASRERHAYPLRPQRASRSICREQRGWAKGHDDGEGANGQATCSCQNEAANEVVVRLFDTDLASSRLEGGDGSTTLWWVGAAAAGGHEGQNVGVVHQGDEVALSRLDTNTGKTLVLHGQAK